MLVREAKWFARRLAELGDDAVHPMLNVGSHTEQFRTREQPWIDRHLFAPARRSGRAVVHLDIQPLPGVDVVGDLTDPAVLADLAAMEFRSAFCSNLLEHVPNPGAIAAAVVQAVRPGGYLFVSCPNRFPYHPDPIDTMFRPGVEELAGLFPGTTIVRGERLAGGTLVHYAVAKAVADPGVIVKKLLRRPHPDAARTAPGLSPLQWLPWAWRTFYQTCLVLRKPE